MAVLVIRTTAWDLSLLAPLIFGNSYLPKVRGTETLKQAQLQVAQGMSNPHTLVAEWSTIWYLKPWPKNFKCVRKTCFRM